MLIFCYRFALVVAVVAVVVVVVVVAAVVVVFCFSKACDLTRPGQRPGDFL